MSRCLSNRQRWSARLASGVSPPREMPVAMNSSIVRSPRGKRYAPRKSITKDTSCAPPTIQAVMSDLGTESAISRSSGVSDCCTHRCRSFLSYARLAFRSCIRSP